MGTAIMNWEKISGPGVSMAARIKITIMAPRLFFLMNSRLTSPSLDRTICARGSYIDQPPPQFFEMLNKSGR
jgi:hypothetical protein